MPSHNLAMIAWIKSHIRFGHIIIGLVLARIFIFIYFLESGARIIHPDSAQYLELASKLIQNWEYYLPNRPDAIIEPFGVPAEDTMRSMATPVGMGPEIFRTPGYPLFLVVLHWLGIDAPFAIAFVQELIYGVAVYIFYYYGIQLFNKTVVQITVITLMIGVSGIIWPKYLIADTLFFPFFLLGIFNIGIYLKKPELRLLIIAGLSFGIGTLIRPGIQYFPIVVAVVLLVFDFKNTTKWRHIGMMFLVFLMVLSPWLIRNYYHFGHLYMSGQASNLVTYYHVPTVMQYKTGIEHLAARAEVRKVMKKVIQEKEQALGRKLNSVEYFKTQQSWALKELGKDPMFVFKHWMIAILKNLYEPFTIDLYYALRLDNMERPHLFAIMAGNSGIEALDNEEGSNRLVKFAQRLGYYLWHQDHFYLFITAFSFLTLIFFLIGVLVILTKKDRFLWLMMLANFYFVATPGLEVFGRFRFPVDGFVFIQACLGLIAVYQLLQSYRNKKAISTDFDNYSAD